MGNVVSSQDAAIEELKAIRAMVLAQPDGEYHIPGIRFSDQSAVVYALHTMVSNLSTYFPEYVWETADSLFPQNTGITVRWKRKKESIKSARATRPLEQ